MMIDGGFERPFDVEALKRPNRVLRKTYFFSNYVLQHLFEYAMNNPTRYHGNFTISIKFVDMFNSLKPRNIFERLFWYAFGKPDMIPEIEVLKEYGILKEMPRIIAIYRAPLEFGKTYDVDLDPVAIVRFKQKYGKRT